MAGQGLLLLALPDPCLLRVLQCLASEDVRSLFSAARAHIRLHQAAVVALRSITARVFQQQQMSDVMGYVGKHCQHVNSLELKGNEDSEDPEDDALVSLRQLPPQLQLSSLQLNYLSLQLQPGNGCQGVLGETATVADLKQLRLGGCEMLDSGASGALSQLPAGLEHLSICDLYVDSGEQVHFPAGVLQQLQHLTHLELGLVSVAGPDEASPALQPLQALTQLAVLELDRLREAITSSMLSGMQHLTRLELSVIELEPGALAGKTKVQHLCIDGCEIRGGAAGEAQLLSHLQPLQQLTHLCVRNSLRDVEGSSPPAGLCAALTASSKLQLLDFSHCTLPAGVWQHMFPAGRQLPHLQSLDVTGVRQPNGKFAQPPECSRLVSCCPGLQFVSMWLLQCSAELLAPLQGLTGLQKLWCDWEDATAEVVQAVCQLTGLRELVVHVMRPGSARLKDEGMLLQLTQLKRLTRLQCWASAGTALSIHLAGVEDQPVWRQLARLHLDNRDLEVAQQAALALADLQ